MVVGLAGVKVEQGAKVIVSHSVLVGGDLVGVDLSNSVGDWVGNSKTKAVTNNALSDSVCLGFIIPLAILFTMFCAFFARKSPKLEKIPRKTD